MQSTKESCRLSGKNEQLYHSADRHTPPPPMPPPPTLRCSQCCVANIILEAGHLEQYGFVGVIQAIVNFYGNTLN